jgi:hypothetical protein
MGVHPTLSGNKIGTDTIRTGNKKASCIAARGEVSELLRQLELQQTGVDEMS